MRFDFWMNQLYEKRKTVLQRTTGNVKSIYSYRKSNLLTTGFKWIHLTQMSWEDFAMIFFQRKYHSEIWICMSNFKPSQPIQTDSFQPDRNRRKFNELASNYSLAIQRYVQRWLKHSKHFPHRNDLNGESGSNCHELRSRIFTTLESNWTFIGWRSTLDDFWCSELSTSFNNERLFRWLCSVFEYFELPFAFFKGLL